MGGLASLIFYTVLIGILELLFDFTVGQLLLDVIGLLTGGR